MHAARFLALSLLLNVVACADSSEPDGAGGNLAGGTDNGPSNGSTSGGGECLLHACKDDSYCAGCSQGRTKCNVAEERCVACDVNSPNACPEGEVCSSFGNCVPEGKTCQTDANGEPTIACASSADCVACDPQHQVCDPATSKCVACTTNDTAECLQTDKCEDGKCVPRCPSTCQSDNDCGECGTAAAPARGCNAHKCSECSDTWACPSGQVCAPNGTCQIVCGLPDAPGVCNFDSDCSGCGEGYTCKTPLNGGSGVCIPPAAGCEDLGQGTLALPPPWNQVTQTCSSDANCSNVSIDYNIGKALRDLTGFGTDVIDDANISYGMNVCASIEIADNSCGLCVPCREDSDCNDIDIDAVTSDLFPGLGGVALAVVLDQIFGDQPHKVYLYCETVAAGYGVCAPCPGVVNECGVGSPTDPTGCPGDVDATCCANVCGVDPYCCDTAWDATCESEEAELCAASCDHGGCEAGAALSPSCTPCVADVCDVDPYCCTTSWDSTCVGEYDTMCGGCI